MHKRMKLEVGDNQGHIIVDDTTGKIIFVMVQNAIEGKFDYYSFGSYKNNHDGTHEATRWICSNHATQQDEDEAAEELRMRIIMQNGNTGEHYDIYDRTIFSERD